jgi:hypothetical protein
MIEIAFRHGLSEVLTSAKVTEKSFGEIDRGWQDKSRKVRPVGRLGNVSNLNHAPNIARNWHNLPIWPKYCSSSVFRTLRRVR